MVGERFRIRSDHFETHELENSTPFNVRYLQTEIGVDNEKPEYNETYDKNYVTTFEVENSTPFNVRYLQTEIARTDSQGNEYAYREFAPEYDVDSKEEIFSAEAMPGESSYDEVIQEFANRVLFSNEIHDPNFTDMLGEIADETDGKFQKFLHEKAHNRTFYEAIVDSDFESNLDQYFESNYRQPVSQMEEEIDKFSQYLEQNLDSRMTFQSVESVIDSYPVKPELFSLGGILSKATKIAKGAVNAAKKIASKVGKILPLNFIISKLLKLLKGKIEPILKSMLRRVIKSKSIPEKYRPMAQTALDFMSGKLKEGAEDQLRSEIINDNLVPATRESFQLFDTGTSIENQLYGIDYIERELDDQMFLLAGTLHEQNESIGTSDIAESEAAIAEEYLDSEESEPIENEIAMSEIARRDFISGLTNGTSEIKDLTENFIPAAWPLLKLAMKIPGARGKIVNTLAKLATPILAKLIGKGQAPELSKVLVDRALGAIQLETPEIMPKDQYLAATAANIVTEAAERVLHLPKSVLEASEDILEPFVRDALFYSTVNNVPSEILDEGLLSLRKIPKDAHWGLMENGKYKIFSKNYQLTLHPDLASSIYSGRGAETLLHVLGNQGWDCTTPIPVTIKVFQATPFTRLSMIARDFLGGTDRNKIRQILWLSPQAATMLINEPQLAIDQRHPGPLGSIAGLRFYIVKVEGPTNSQTYTRPDGINVRFKGPKSLEVNLYFSTITYNIIKVTPSTSQDVELYRKLESIFLPTTRKILGDLLTQLRVPSFAINEIVSRIQIWVLEHSKTYVPKLLPDFLAEGNKSSAGVTVTINLNLPDDFLNNLANLTSDKLGEFISELVKFSPSADFKILSGYHL